MVTASSRHTGEGRCPFLPSVPAFAGNAKYWNAKMRQLISSGSKFEAEAGYSRAVVDAEWVFVAGTTGFDYARMTIVDDPAEQATKIALDAIQLLGGNGYINDYATGRLLRDAKLYEIGAGTSEIRRMLIGREIFEKTR